MTYPIKHSRADICKYPYPEASTVAESMGIKRERDTLLFTSPQHRLEYEQKVREARAERKKVAA
jgi:hypothetical protein